MTRVIRRRAVVSVIVDVRVGVIQFAEYIEEHEVVLVSILVVDHVRDSIGQTGRVVVIVELIKRVVMLTVMQMMIIVILLLLLLLLLL